jgi:hypothetical protein
MLHPRGTMLTPQRTKHPKTQKQLGNQPENGKIRKSFATTKKKQPKNTHGQLEKQVLEAIS